MPKKLTLDKENEFEERKNNAKELIASIHSESDILEKLLSPSPYKKRSDLSKNSVQKLQSYQIIIETNVW